MYFDEDGNKNNSLNQNSAEFTANQGSETTLNAVDFQLDTQENISTQPNQSKINTFYSDHPLNDDERQNIIFTKL